MSHLKYEGTTPALCYNSQFTGTFKVKTLGDEDVIVLTERLYTALSGRTDESLAKKEKLKKSTYR